MHSQEAHQALRRAIDVYLTDQCFLGCYLDNSIVPSSQEMATDEAEFRAAVKLICDLPNDGQCYYFSLLNIGHVNSSSFHFHAGLFDIPTSQMLRFYVYFMQATKGPCTQPKPHFWQLIEKVKWNAWKKLGNMSKEEAMTKLVELVKQVCFVLSFFNFLLP
jgi:acyl-CoA-binding protein